MRHVGYRNAAPENFRAAFQDGRTLCGKGSRGSV
jgi:hypothetical protein